MPQRFASARGKPAGSYIDAFINGAKETSRYLFLVDTNSIRSQRIMPRLCSNTFLLQFKTCQKNLAAETADVCYRTTYSNCPAWLQQNCSFKIRSEKSLNMENKFLRKQTLTTSAFYNIRKVFASCRLC